MSDQPKRSASDSERFVDIADPSADPEREHGSEEGDYAGSALATTKLLPLFRTLSLQTDEWVIETVSGDDEPESPDFNAGVTLGDFLEYLCPDLFHRVRDLCDSSRWSHSESCEEAKYLVDDKNLGAISDLLRRHLEHLRNHQSGSAKDVALRLILEKRSLTKKSN